MHSVNNVAKLFRHFDAGEIEAEQVAVFHIFIRHCELSRGRFSSKRENAEFIGQMAAEKFNGLSNTIFTRQSEVQSGRKTGKKQPTKQLIHSVMKFRLASGLKPSYPPIEFRHLCRIRRR